MVKPLLDVRNKSCNNTCLVQADMSSLRALVKKKMRKYLQEKHQKLQNDDPLSKALEQGRSDDTKSYRYVQAVLGNHSNILWINPDVKNK